MHLQSTTLQGGCSSRALAPRCSLSLFHSLVGAASVAWLATFCCIRSESMLVHSCDVCPFKHTLTRNRTLQKRQSKQLLLACRSWLNERGSERPCKKHLWGMERQQASDVQVQFRLHANRFVGNYLLACMDVLAYFATRWERQSHQVAWLAN